MQNQHKRNKTGWLYVLLTCVLALVLSLKSFTEPDLWWQIRTGEWILENGVPKIDPFSFTFFGVEWINIKWGFEVMAALITKSLGVESIMLWQWPLLAVVLWVCYRHLKSSQNNNPAIYFLTVVPLLFAITYRVTGRPELISIVASFTMAYALIRAANKGFDKSYLWTLPLLQLVWTNTHEAYGIGIALLGLYVVVDFAHKKWTRGNWQTTPLLALGLSLLVIPINPYGWVMLVRPLNIFQQVQVNKFTYELAPIWESHYWTYGAYAFVITLSLVLMLVVKKGLRFKTDFPWLFQCALLAAFGVLALMANRNIPFFIMMAWLVIVAQMKLTIRLKPLLAIATTVLLYGLVVSNAFYNLCLPKYRYGLQVMPHQHPIQATTFIEQNGWQADTNFTDYLSSAYMLWKMQPAYKSYIDLRDLDVFTDSFFQVYTEAHSIPDAFLVQDSLYKFQYVALHRVNNSIELHRYLYNDSLYACIYVDPVMAIYTKTDDLPQQDFYHFPPPAETKGLAMVINKVFNPLYKDRAYSASEINYDAGVFFFEMGKITWAEQRFKAVLAEDIEHEQARFYYDRIQVLKQQHKIK